MIFWGCFDFHFCDGCVLFCFIFQVKSDYGLILTRNDYVFFKEINLLGFGCVISDYLV